jgi:hypothetical protein
MRKGKLRFPLAVFGLVMTIALSMAGQQPGQAQNPDPQKPAERNAVEQQAPGAQPPATTPPGQGDAKSAEKDKKPQDAQPGEQKPPEAGNLPPQSGISKDRLFWTLPNFLTLENASQMPPLTPGQKFKAVAKGTFDPVQFSYYFVLAGISQAENSEPGYGQGWEGYGKRFGAIFGDTTIENFMVGAVFPSVLRQDPRYFQKGKGGFARRWGYALSRILVTRGDSGREQFNASEFFGSALAAGISTYSYHPRGDKTVDNALSVWGTQVGLDAVGNTVKEFWPDIRRKFGRKKGTAEAAAGKQ